MIPNLLKVNSANNLASNTSDGQSLKKNGLTPESFGLDEAGENKTTLLSVVCGTIARVTELATAPIIIGTRFIEISFWTADTPP